MNLTQKIKKLHDREIFFRIENDDDGWYISHVDRSKFPRLWMDNAVENKPSIIAETVEHTLERCSPLPEKDWRYRVYNEDLDTAIDIFLSHFDLL